MLMPSEAPPCAYWADPLKAKAHLGVPPDGDASLRQKLTGERLITYSGYLHGIDKKPSPRQRLLLAAMDTTDAAGRAVADYSAGMTKKIALAAALVHAPSVRSG